MQGVAPTDEPRTPCNAYPQTLYSVNLTNMENQTTTNTEGWSRMPPRGGRCPITGMSAGRLYRLIAHAGGAIRTVSLQEDGCNRGTRLIDPKSLLAYLDRLADQQSRREGTA